MPKQQVSMRIDPELYKQARMEALKQGLSFRAYIEGLISNNLNHRAKLRDPSR